MLFEEVYTLYLVLPNLPKCTYTYPYPLYRNLMRDTNNMRALRAICSAQNGSYPPKTFGTLEDSAAMSWTMHTLLGRNCESNCFMCLLLAFYSSHILSHKCNLHKSAVGGTDSLKSSYAMCILPRIV